MEYEIQPAGETSLDLKRTALSFSNEASKMVFEFYNVTKDQFDIYKVPDKPDMRQSAKDVCASFGIIVGQRMVIDQTDRNYIIIIEPSWWDSLEEKCTEFVGQYIPAPHTPTHYVINKEINKYEELVTWEEKIKSIYPDIMSLAIYDDLASNNRQITNQERLASEVTSLGYTPLYIGPMMNPLVEEFKLNNRSTLDLFRKLEAEILQKHKENPRIILMSGLENLDYVPVVTAYMYYKYKIPCHLNPSKTRQHLAGVSSLLFSTKTMLLEEQIMYIKNLPRVAVTFDPFTQFHFFVFLEKAKMDCRLRMSYVDLENITSSDVTKIEMDINELSIIPWKYEFDLETNDLEVFREEHNKIMSLFVKFEEKCPNVIELLSLNNTCILEIDGRKKLAFVEHIDLKLPSVFTPLNKKLAKAEKMLNLDFLPRLYPIDILPDYKTALAPHIIALKHAIQKANSGEVSLNNLAAFYKHDHAFGHVIYQFNNFGHKLLGITSEKDFVTLGLWWKESVSYREGLARDLERYLYTKKTRKFNNFFSIFGGPFPMFGDLLSVREEILKEWQYDH